MEKLPINEVLRGIQQQLNAPKDKTNEFGKYKYRTAEGILAAAKPLLELARCSVVMCDEMVLLGDRYYIKATATLTDDSGNAVSASAYAREAEKQGGMSDGQITGATSSYARKYALCGLFAIDSGEDLDSIAANDQKAADIFRGKQQSLPKETKGAKAKAEPLVSAPSDGFDMPF